MPGTGGAIYGRMAANKRLTGKVVEVYPAETGVGFIKRRGKLQVVIDIDAPSEDWQPEAGMDFVGVFCKRKRKRKEG